MFGRERTFKVFLRRESEDDEIRSKEISEGELCDYGTEIGNEDNKRNVDFIGITLPHPLLRTGLVIVDTPGVGGLHKKHRDITWKYAPSADAIFFVLTSTEKTVTHEELSFLKELRENVTNRIYFLQTKIDATDTKKWQEYQENNLTVLSEKLDVPKEKLLYFPVSSKQRIQSLLKAGDLANIQDNAEDYTDSQFGKVLHFLHYVLINYKNTWLASEFLINLQRHISVLQKQLSSELDSLDSKEKIQNLVDQLNREQSEFRNWKTREYPDLVKQLNQFIDDEYAKIREQADQRFNSADASNTHYFNRLAFRDDLSPKEFEDHCNHTFSDVSSALSNWVLQTERGFVKRMNEKLRSSSNIGGSISESIDHYALRVMLDSLVSKMSTFDRAKGQIIGFSAGMGITANLINLIWPGAGFAVGIFAGLFAGAAMKEAVDSKQKEQISRMARQNLKELLAKGKSDAFSRFEKQRRLIQNEITNTLEETAESMDRSFEKRIQRHQQQLKSTREELTKTENRLRTSLAKIESIQNAVKQIVA